MQALINYLSAQSIPLDLVDPQNTPKDSLTNKIYTLSHAWLEAFPSRAFHLTEEKENKPSSPLSSFLSRSFNQATNKICHVQRKILSDKNSFEAVEKLFQEIPPLGDVAEETIVAVLGPLLHSFFEKNTSFSSTTSYFESLFLEKFFSLSLPTNESLDILLYPLLTHPQITPSLIKKIIKFGLLQENPSLKIYFPGTTENNFFKFLTKNPHLRAEHLLVLLDTLEEHFEELQPCLVPPASNGLLDFISRQTDLSSEILERTLIFCNKHTLSWTTVPKHIAFRSLSRLYSHPHLSPEIMSLLLKSLDDSFIFVRHKQGFSFPSLNLFENNSLSNENLLKILNLLLNTSPLYSNFLKKHGNFIIQLLLQRKTPPSEELLTFCITHFYKDIEKTGNPLSYLLKSPYLSLAHIRVFFKVFVPSYFSPENLFLSRGFTDKTNVLPMIYFLKNKARNQDRSLFYALLEHMPQHVRENLFTLSINEETLFYQYLSTEISPTNLEHVLAHFAMPFRLEIIRQDEEQCKTGKGLMSYFFSGFTADNKKTFIQSWNCLQNFLPEDTSIFNHINRSALNSLADSVIEREDISAFILSLIPYFGGGQRLFDKLFTPKEKSISIHVLDFLFLELLLKEASEDQIPFLINQFLKSFDIPLEDLFTQLFENNCLFTFCYLLKQPTKTPLYIPYFTIQNLLKSNENNFNSNKKIALSPTESCLLYNLNTTLFHERNQDVNMSSTMEIILNQISIKDLVSYLIFLKKTDVSAFLQVIKFYKDSWFARIFFNLQEQPLFENFLQENNIFSPTTFDCMPFFNVQQKKYWFNQLSIQSTHCAKQTEEEETKKNLSVLQQSFRILFFLSKRLTNESVCKEIINYDPNDIFTNQEPPVQNSSIAHSEVLLLNLALTNFLTLISLSIATLSKTSSQKNEPEIPTDFLCCIMQEPMTDPILIHNTKDGKCYIDKTTYDRFLQDGSLNPFNRQPLDKNLLVDEELKKEINRWKEKQNGLLS